MTTCSTKSAFALTVLICVALLGTPALAVEPDVDSPAGPELTAPRTDRPDFELEDQTGAEISPEGKPVIVEPDIVSEFPSVVIPERHLPNPDMDDLSPTR
jgi:hypothetical protein